ncbi:MAG TPA: hypothetical protein VKX17_03250 [Planctomycetota bacterium]|nr:hypothetical protein [Planctomycetota bacterium]
MGGGHEESSGHGGDRPWVYFMIDSFFLVTQFFVLTFKLRIADDLVLPHRLPPGGQGRPTETTTAPKTPVGITVIRSIENSPPQYQMNGGELLDERAVTQKLGDIVEGKNPDNYSVRISYEGKGVIFKDVMPIFNTCLKLRIKECGLQPTRQQSRV